MDGVAKEATPLAPEMEEVATPPSANTSGEVTSVDNVPKDDPTHPKRVINPTEKGAEYFRAHCGVYQHKLCDIGAKLDSVMQSQVNDISLLSLPELTQVESDLSKLFDQYQKVGNEYLEFLARHNTEQSVTEQSSHSFVRRSYAEKVMAVRRMLSCKANPVDMDARSSKSGKSRSSRQSQRTNSSVSTVVQKQLNAEAARARLKFIKRESELKRSAAAIQADMDEL